MRRSNARFLAEPLPGRDESLGSPSVGVARLGVDSGLVAGLRPQA